ncbi:MAG: type I DNA topoisomerase [Bacteroidales bacterium]|nr:type I DNA topoisomerase [Bacteroidales bacterium]
MKGNNLVIVESPAKAKTIQRFLGEDFTVKPSFGHIRDLKDKTLSIDLDHGFAPQYVVPDDKKRVVADLKRLADKADIVWLASDEDREGEAISWHLTDALEIPKEKTRRIVFHEITKDAILNAVNNPRELDMNLVNAQQARRVLDRLVGFEISPILWKKIGRGLSAGRVQSVALRLVVDREREIIAFTPEAYYRITGNFRIAGKSGIYGSLDKHFATEEQARAFLEDSKASTYTIENVDRKEAERWPAPPFTTSTLQQEASRKLRMPVSVTMRIAQSLYEKGLITYMRTDSTNLSALALGTAKKFIIDQFGPEYSNPRQFKTHSKGAQEAHEAIRPTFIENTSINGNSQEQKLYELIWKRTVASQMASARMENTEITAGISNRPEKFIIRGARILFDGFLKLYSEGVDDAPEEERTAILPEISKGDTATAVQMKAECKFTKAPYRYSEATLVKKLEELGIGRPSTYAPTISTLTTGRGYLVRGGKDGTKVQVRNLSLKGDEISVSTKTETIGEEHGKLLPQEVGMIVTDYLVQHFPDILDYDFTANVEKDFDIIAEGGKVWNDVIKTFYDPFHKEVDADMHDGQYSKVERLLGTDPVSGEPISAKFGQYGAYVQKGEGENRQFANLAEGQLIETITLEEALQLFALPRTVGSYEGSDIVAMKGRFGPYLKWNSQNFSLPRGKDPLKVTLEECIAIVAAQKDKPAAGEPLAEFGDIKVLSGRYGNYIKYNGSNYRIPRNTKPEELTEEFCRRIISEGAPTSSGKKFHKRFSKK